MRALTPETAKLLTPIQLADNDRLGLSLQSDGKYFLARSYAVYEAADGSVSETFPSYRTNKLWSRIPERSRLNSQQVGEHWKLGATDTTVTIISESWPADKIVFEGADAKLMFNYLIANHARQSLNAEITAHFKEHNIVPNHELDIHPNVPLAGYQQVATFNAMDNEGYALYMEQGTGKTAIVVARICNEAKRLWEGSYDEKGYQQSVTQIRAHMETEIEEMRVDLTAKLESSLKRKEEKLKNAAQKRASLLHVRLNFDGPAAELLNRAKQAVVEAERWLGTRYAEIALEMRQLRSEATNLLHIQMTAEEKRMKEAADRTVAMLQKRRIAGVKRPYLALIVCPKQLRFNWELEFCRFATTRGRLTRIAGHELKRTKQLIDAIEVDPEDRYSVVIISYDSLGRTQGLDRIPWDLAVLDESHFVKNSGTKRWKACRDLRARARQRMVLTGTPITNTVMDLYTQWEFLGDGWSGFSSHAAFKQFYGVFDERDTSTGFGKIVGVQNLPFMKERIAQQAFVVKKSEVLKDLPDKQYDVWEVEMTEEQTELYNKVRDALVVQIENELDRSDTPKSMMANNILTKLLRLAQVTSGFMVYDPVYGEDGTCLREKIIDRLDPNPKLEALVEILKDKTSKDKTIVWATFVQDLKSISARLKMEEIDHVLFYGGTSDADREEAVRRFNEDPRCKVFVGNPTAGGTGLNLLGYPPGHEHADLYDTNANHVIYFSQNWSMPARAQSEDRCHRRGTREPVRITDLTVPDTIDQEIRSRVLSKRQHADDVANIKELLKSIFNRTF